MAGRASSFATVPPEQPDARQQIFVDIDTLDLLPDFERTARLSQRQEHELNRRVNRAFSAQGRRDDLSANRDRRNAVSLMPNPLITRGASPAHEASPLDVPRTDTAQATCLLRCFELEGKSNSRTRRPAQQLSPPSPLERLGRKLSATIITKARGISPKPIRATGIPVDQRYAAQRLYSPIHEWQTRILTLHPGSYGDELLTSLHVVNLLYGKGVLLREKDERIQYDAISHCWGDPNFTHRILCNGDPYPVTHEVHGLLQQLRSLDKPRHLWLDALCINQHDPQERSTQVAEMLTIYKKAQYVVVWLGEHGNHTETVFRAVEAWDELAWSLIGPHTFKDLFSRDLLTKVSGLIKSRAFASDLYILCASCEEQLLQGLEDFFNRPWYNRVWVKQEVWAAQAVRIVCGANEISWDLLPAEHGIIELLKPLLLERHGHRYSRIRQKCGSIVSRLPTADPMAFARQQLGDKPNEWLQDTPEYKFDIVNVLRRSVGTQCSDPRDHIYGILGMTTTHYHSADLPDREPSLIVDYSRSVSQVFQDLTIYLIRREKSLSVLHLDATYGGGHGDATLPSWVPDWRATTRSTEWLTLLMSAVSQVTVVAPTNDTISSRPGTLSLQGFEVGWLESYNRPPNSLLHPLLQQTPPPQTIRPPSDEVQPSQDSIAHSDRIHMNAQMCALPYAATQSIEATATDYEMAIIAQLWNVHRGTKWNVPAGARPYDTIIAVEGAYSPLLIRSKSGPFARSQEIEYEFIGSAAVSSLSGPPCANGDFVHPLVHPIFGKLLLVRSNKGQLRTFNLV